MDQFKINATFADLNKALEMANAGFRVKNTPDNNGLMFLSWTIKDHTTNEVWRWSYLGFKQVHPNNLATVFDSIGAYSFATKSPQCAFEDTENLYSFSAPARAFTVLDKSAQIEITEPTRKPLDLDKTAEFNMFDNITPEA